MYARKQQGKGLTGFVFGLILATAAIGGILFMLNNNKNKDFKQPEQTERPAQTETEKLAPPTVLPESIPSAPESNEARDTERNDDPTPNIPDSEPETKLPEQSDKPVIRPNAESKPKVVEPKTQPKTDTQPTERRETADKPVHKPAQTQPRTEPSRAETRKPGERPAELKPTPEQILNSGSIEKARHDLQKQKEKAAAAAPTVDSSSGKRVKIQAGSFSDRAGAEAQRAKIALLGVHTQIIEAQSNGRTVYRVQTGSLDNKQAAKTAATLQQNGINTISR